MNEERKEEGLEGGRIGMEGRIREGSEMKEGSVEGRHE